MAEYKFTLKWNNYIHTSLNTKHHVGRNRVMPDLNNYLVACGRHPQIGGRMKKDYMMYACNEIRKQIPNVRIAGKVFIRYSHYEADKRRDPSNCASMATKVIEDALQTCGVITNDGWENIAGYSQEFDVDKANPRIEVTITEVE
jgi:Holliday junction resolvase RusA-like endonuclease